MSFSIRAGSPIRRAKSLKLFTFGAASPSHKKSFVDSRKFDEDYSSSDDELDTDSISTMGTSVTGTDVDSEASLDFVETMETFRVILEQRILDSLLKLGGIAFFITFMVYWWALEPELNWLEALYFTMSTFTTIGYGDIRPTSTPSRIFTVFLLYITILPVALALAATAEYLATRLEVERMHREQLLITAMYTKDNHHHHHHQHHHHSLTHLNHQSVSSQPHQGSNHEYIAVSKQDPDQQTPVVPVEKVKATPVLDEGEIAFQSQASEPWPMLLLKMALTVVAVAVIYTACEEAEDFSGQQEQERRRFSVIKSVYFATATATTIGYGDVYPKTDLGRAFAIIYMPLSILVFGNGVGAVAQVVFRVLIATTTDGEEVVLVRRHALRRGGLTKGIGRCRHWKAQLFPEEYDSDVGDTSSKRSDDRENGKGGDSKVTRFKKKTTNDYIAEKQQEKAIRALSGQGTSLDKAIPSAHNSLLEQSSDQEDLSDDVSDEEDPLLAEGGDEALKGADKFEFTLLMLLAMGKIEFKSISDVHALIRERKEQALLNQSLGSAQAGSDSGSIGSDTKKRDRLKAVDLELLNKMSKVKIWPLIVSLIAVLFSSLVVALTVGLGQDDVFKSTFAEETLQ